MSAGKQTLCIRLSPSFGSKKWLYLWSTLSCPPASVWEEEVVSWEKELDENTLKEIKSD